MRSRSKLLVALCCSLIACQTSPEVLEAQESDSTIQGIFETKAETPSSPEHNAQDRHRVELIDSLQGSKYSYFLAQEEGKEFWIATMKVNFPLQAPYVFERGLYKTNYYSSEFDRNFEEIYLVSDLRPLASHRTQTGDAIDQLVRSDQAQKAVSSSASLEREGSIKIRELISNADAYVGKKVQITAKVTKINPNIMDRNWLHLKDGSFDSFDLVATSLEAVPAGHIVTLEATFAKDVNFGAGYTYDFILQNAQLLN